MFTFNGIEINYVGSFELKSYNAFACGMHGVVFEVNCFVVTCCGRTIFCGCSLRTPGRFECDCVLITFVQLAVCAFVFVDPVLCNKFIAVVVAAAFRADIELFNWLWVAFFIPICIWTNIKWVVKITIQQLKFKSITF